MTFTIPNSSGTYDARQAEPDKIDIDILAAGFNAFGVISGCTISATTSSLVLNVAVGVVLNAGCKVPVSAGTVTLTSGDATFARFDIVNVTTSGAVQVTNGTASSTPVFPTIATTSVVALAAVFVPVAAVVTSSSQIVDKRVLISEFDADVPQGRFKNNTASTVYYSVPGVALVSQGTLALTSPADYFFPMFIATTVTFDQLAAEVTTAAVASGVTFRMGLYKADTNWQPTSLVTDSGAIGATSAGIRTFTPGTPIVLPPGRYVGVIAASSTPTMRTVLGTVAGAAYLDTLGSSLIISQFRNARAFAAFPDPGTSWSAVTNAATNPVNMVFLRISTP